MNFEDYYILDKWETFLDKFEINNGLFIGNIGFEDRTLSALNLLKKFQKNSLKKLKFLLFYLESQSILTKDLDNLGFKFDPPKIEKKKEININKILKLRLENHLNLDLFSLHIDDKNRQIIGFEEVFLKVKEELDQKDYKFIFLDISSFPKSIFIPLIKILFEFSKVRNLLIIWTNKGGLTFETNVLNYDQAITLPRFSHIDPDYEDMVFWLPILNNDPNTISLVLNQRRFQKNISYYPLLTFPTKWPDETNNILMKNREFFLSKRFEIEKVLYVPYNNPFEIYLRINDFYKSKEFLYGKNFFIYLSPFGTKAQSLGLCLSAILLNRVSLLICRPVEYQDDPDLHSNNEIHNSHIAWIKGDYINTNRE